MPLDIRETILSQYSSSPRLMALIFGLAEVLGTQKDLQTFYKNVFDIDTAKGVGLDIWGRIVGISRSAQMVTSIGVPYLGFEAKGVEAVKGFNQAQFYKGKRKTKLALSDDAYRLYIKVKAAANITNGSLAELNALLAQLLPKCKVSLTRIAPMHLKLTCSGPLKDYQKNMLLLGDLPPIPSGVKLDIVINGAQYLGFNADNNTGFNDGPFYQR